VFHNNKLLDILPSDKHHGKSYLRSESNYNINLSKESKLFLGSRPNTNL